MGLFDDVSNFAENTIKNTVNNYALDALNSVFDNIPYLSDLGFNISSGSIFNTQDRMSDLEKYSGEFSAKNRFDFVFVLPTMLRKEDPNINDILRVFCRQFPVPSTSTNVNKQKIMNRTVSGVNSLDFDTINATFFDTKSLSLHKLFTRWNLDKWNARGQMQFYPNEYKTDVMIINHDNQVYLMKGLHPVSVGDVVFSHDSIDEILSFDVTFSIDSIVPYGDSKISISSSNIGFNTGLDFLDDIGNFGLNLAQNYFNNQINQTVRNATSSLTSKIGF